MHKYCGKDIFNEFWGGRQDENERRIFEDLGSVLKMAEREGFEPPHAPKGVAIVFETSTLPLGQLSVFTNLLQRNFHFHSIIITEFSIHI